MQHYTIDSSLAAMKNQLSVIDSRIRELYMIRSRLVNRCSRWKRRKDSVEKKTPYFLEDINPQYILLTPVEEPYTLREISIATKKMLCRFLPETTPPYFFNAESSFPWNVSRKAVIQRLPMLFLPIEKTDKAENMRKLPAGKCVGIYHVGDYLSIGRSYEKILEYCRSHNLKICSDSYEFCINDYITLL